MRSPANPHHRLRLVARHSLTVGVHDSEIKLSQRMALFSGLAIPVGGLSIIQRRSFSVCKFQSEIELSFGNAAFCLGFDSFLKGHRGTAEPPPKERCFHNTFTS